MFLHVNNEAFVRIIIFNKIKLTKYPCAYTSRHIDTCMAGDKRPEHS
jgi:hypothetical protein